MTQVSKICSFYVSDWHLITMLLPHVNKMINEDVKITTIFEQDASKKIQILLSKLKLKNERMIKRINWNETLNVNKKIQEIFKGCDEKYIEIIVAGSVNYINEANNEINGLLVTNSESNVHVKIINCYNVDKINMNEILQSHDGILNTAGEKTKEDFLEELKKA